MESSAFAARFGTQPSIAASVPGRVNLIGEHTDYNDGLVMPVAVDRYVRIVAAPNGEDRIRLYASAYEERAEFPVDAPEEAAVPRWARYPQGVAVNLGNHGVRLAGVDALIGGDLPIGSGLSSSAALEVATSLVLEQTAGGPLRPRERALLCHQAEVEFVGVPCGIMDQFAVSLCRRGHALFLDCRSRETHHIPLPPDVVLAVCDTGIRRSLEDSGYATRRRECEDAVRRLRTRRPGITSLRDVTMDDLSLLDELPPPLDRRARHVVTENARVIAAARALEGGHPEHLRNIFGDSHRSLRDDYEVSCPELDAMVAAALDAPGCIAARMTGAGFGGAVIALVRRKERHPFLEAAASIYRQRTNRSGVCFTSEAAGGAAYTR